MIRSENATSNVEVDVIEFMATGADRFAVGSQFTLVQIFFAPFLTSPTVPPGTYNKAELGVITELDTFSWSMQQYNWEDEIDDYFDRVWVYNSMEFSISDDAVFIVEADGSKRIENFAVFPRETVIENFDLDSNDGLTGIANSVFSDLQVWRDLNSDGRTDGNELFTLDELGISRIRTAASSTNITNAGNQMTETSHFELADGSQREIANVGFSVEQLNSYYDPYSTFNSPVVFTAEILSLPNLRGYGNLPSLQIAMATDEQLLARVRFLTEEMSGDVASAGGRIRSILLRWAGVDGTAPTSRGSNVNAQELGFLEKFLGSSYPQNLTITAAAGQTLSQTYISQADTRCITCILTAFAAADAMFSQSLSTSRTPSNCRKMSEFWINSSPYRSFCIKMPSIVGNTDASGDFSRDNRSDREQQP